MDKSPKGLVLDSEWGAKVVEIFAATRSTDLAEGKGPYIDHSYHLTKNDALVGSTGLVHSFAF